MTRDVFLAAFALAWPLARPEALADVIVCLPDSLDSATGVLKEAYEPDRPRAERDLLDRLRAEHTATAPRPSVKWTPAGRHKGTDTWDGDELKYRAALTAAFDVLSIRGKALTEENVSQVFEQELKLRSCDARRVRAWNDAYEIDWDAEKQRFLAQHHH